MINVDLSTVVIRKQQAQFPEQDWRVMDVLHLEEEWTNRFDAVIDKSMVDTLLCGHADSNGNVLRMFREALRVLRPGGTFVCWSLHKMHEVKVHAAKLGVSLPAPIEGAAPKKKKKVKKVDKRSGQWGYALCRVPNPRFSQEPASNRSVSHTLMLARKCTTATATTTTTTIGSGAAESGQLVELDVAASEAAALSLPSLVDPIPKRFLRWEDGIDDEDEDEKGKECASPIAMSPEEIARCEAIKEGLKLQEAAEECSVDKLRAILGKCLVYESIKRGYNKG
jgi:SAM-dependent methyltransferase